MPTIYRSMKEENGRPALGDSASRLGVRVPADITPSSDGRVHPGVHGMSVAPCLESLPTFLVPRRLRHRVPGAAGSDALRVWRMGQGAWACSDLTPGLRLEQDPAKPDEHGLVSPSEPVPLAEYRAAIAATQPLWVPAE